MTLPGQYYDAESGLHYNYFRTYDPELGRYLTSDPIGLDGGVNTFGYVGSNPVMIADPYGLEPMVVMPKVREQYIFEEAKFFADSSIAFIECIGCTIKDQIRGVIPGLFRDKAIDAALGKEIGKSVSKKILFPVGFVESYSSCQKKILE